MCVEESCVNVCDCHCVNSTTLVMITLVGGALRVTVCVCVSLSLREGPLFSEKTQVVSL